MNTTKNKNGFFKYVLGFVAVVVVGLAAGYAGGARVVSELSTQNLGGNNYNYPVSFDNGIRVQNQNFVNVSPTGTVSVTLPASSSLFVEGRTQVAAFIDGDSNATGTTITTSTIGGVTAANLCDEQPLMINLGASPKTITAPSSSAIFANCLTSFGKHKRVFIQNASGSGSAFTFGISDGSSTIKTIAAASSSAVNGTSSLNGGDIAIIDMLRGVSSSQPWLFYLLQVER